MCKCPLLPLLRTVTGGVRPRVVPARVSSQSLQGKGRRGVTVRPQDPTTPSPCYLESPASLPASETGVPAAQGWCVHQVTVVTSETPRGLASSCQPLLMRRSPALSNSLAPVRPHSARVWTWAAPCTALSWASDGSGISTPREVGGQCCSDVGVPSGRASAPPRGVLFFNITALF